MRRRRCPVVLLVFIALHATPFAGAQAQGDPRSPLSVYGSIAEEYRRGSSSAATQLVALGPSRLMELHDLMGRAVRQPLLLRSGAQPWTPALLRAAGMLHTDVALQAFTRGDVPEFQQHLDAADRVLQLAELSESA